MTDNITVDNYRLTEYKVRTTELADKSEIQHIRLDVGNGSTESPVVGSLPVSIVSGSGDATAANQTLEIAQLEAINAATAANLNMQSMLGELIGRLDTLASCKYHIGEAIRTFPIASVSTAVTGTVTALDATTTSTYITPTYVKFLTHMAQGNLTAEIANIQNVTA